MAKALPLKDLGQLECVASYLTHCNVSFSGHHWGVYLYRDNKDGNVASFADVTPVQGSVRLLGYDDV